MTNFSGKNQSALTFWTKFRLKPNFLKKEHHTRQIIDISLYPEGKRQNSGRHEFSQTEKRKDDDENDSKETVHFTRL
jgi:hypothetical protein